MPETQTPHPEQLQDTAWTDSTLDGNPHLRSDKPARVCAMFASIASSYDLNNRLHSFGMDVRWRRATVRAIKPAPTDSILDVACGTGDLSVALSKANPAEVIGLDFTAEMLDVARTKRGADGVSQYIQGDAMNLPFDADRFDALTIAFGIRNVAEPARALAEFHRVLKPRGRLAILEFGDPSPAPIRMMHNLYTKRIMPWTATAIARDRSGAYRYLPKSVDTFMGASELESSLADVGFGEIHTRRMTFGVCNLITALC